MRIQQVNLYTSELRPRNQRLTATTAVLSLVVVFVGVLAISVWSSYQSRQLEAKLAMTQHRNEQLQAAVTAMSEAVKQRQPDPGLEAELEGLNRTLARRQRLLDRVSGLAVGQSGTFSPLMSALAQQIPDQVWLTGITLELDPLHAEIRGRTRDSHRVPVYLERLGQSAEFRGRTFGSFRLSRPEKGGPVEFFVATRPGEEGGS
ncbi:PilN domain-containing protein [Marinobacter koreensis]|uniref:PilN domain-containing protein n=3 Tax=Marinobacter koreensis TaxID=335974 RepID=A0ABW0RLW6_9GAMM|nr:PilN domain-containing protein [Marinobacter koreensis]MCK7549745.1 PilN domain-containing protein [Marinobacter koreensis]